MKLDNDSWIFILKQALRNYKKEVVDYRTMLSYRLERDIPSEHNPYPGDSCPSGRRVSQTTAKYQLQFFVRGCRLEVYGFVFFWMLNVEYRIRQRPDRYRMLKSALYFIQNSIFKVQYSIFIFSFVILLCAPIFRGVVPTNDNFL